MWIWTAAFVIGILVIPVEGKTFDNEKFTFEYPNGWKLEGKENRFTDREATLETKDGSAMTFEYNPTFEADHMIGSDENIVSTMEEVAENSYDGSIYESGTDKYIVNNQTAPYVLATFDKTNIFGYTHNYVVMVVYIKLNGDSASIAQYIAQEDDFDKHLKQVEKIIQSVKDVANYNPDTTDAKPDIEPDTAYSNEKYPTLSEICNKTTSTGAKKFCDTLLK